MSLKLDFKIRTKIILQKLLVYINNLETLSTIFEKEGIKGLYRGLNPTILGYIPTWAIYFSIYENSKLHISSI